MLNFPLPASNLLRTLDMVGQGETCHCRQLSAPSNDDCDSERFKNPTLGFLPHLYWGEPMEAATASLPLAFWRVSGCLLEGISASK